MTTASFMIVGLILVLFTMITNSVFMNVKRGWTTGVVLGLVIAFFTAMLHLFTVDTVEHAVSFYKTVMGM